MTGEFLLRDYQTSGNTNKNQSKPIPGQQPSDPLLGAAVSNTHFALWTAKMYQVYTNKGKN